MSTLQDDLPSYALPDTPDNNFITPLIEIYLTTAVLTAKGRSGVKYGKYTAELRYGDERKEFSATDAHQTIHTRGALLSAVAALGALKRRCAIRLHTDSEYLLGGASTWFPLGMALGWLGTSDKQTKTANKLIRVRNQVLWEQLRELAARHSIDWVGPRRLNDSEFYGVMPDIKTELWRRTVGEGSDTAALYADHRVLPWSESLGEYRAFTDTEMQAASQSGGHDPALCSSVDCTDDKAVTTLTAKEKQARKTVIARIAEHYRPEHIRPTPRAPIPVPTSSAAPIRLEPTQVHHLFAGYDEVTLLKYPRADRRFKHQTERTAVLEIGIEQ
jgi:ribonuclease HI